MYERNTYVSSFYTDYYYVVLDSSITSSLEGDYEIVSYFDDSSASEDSVALTVVALGAGNDAPVVVAYGYDALTEGDAYSGTLTAYDPNGDVLSYSVVSSPSWMTATRSATADGFLT